MTEPVVPCRVAAGATLDLHKLAGRECTLGDGDRGKYPSFPFEKGTTFSEVVQRHRVLQADTIEFLERSVANPLSQALTAVALKQPLDPTDYLVKWLRRYTEHEERKKAQAIQEAQLLRDRAELKSKRNEELRVDADRAASHDSVHLTKEDKTVLDALEKTTWLSEKEFQRILNHLKSALGVKAAYMLQLSGEGDPSGPVLQYIGADSESTFLIDLTLKEGEGVVWDALPQTDEPEEFQSEDSADSENDEKNPDKEKKQVGETEEVSALDGETQSRENRPRGKIGNPLIVADVMADDRVKFWSMVRPGSLAAISLVFEDAANKANVDATKEYLLEVQSRKKLMQDKENGLKQTASEGEADLLEAESSDDERHDVRRQSETEKDKEGLPAPVPPPTYTYTTAEESTNDEWKELAHEIEKALEKVEMESAPDIDSEKTLTLERLQVKLQQEKEEQQQGKLERIREAENERRQHVKKHGKENQVGVHREESDVSKGRQRSGGEGKRSETKEGDEEEHADGQPEADDGLPDNERHGDIVQADDEAARGKAEMQVSENDTATELGEEDADEDEAMEMLDPILFLDQAEAKVRYEKTCEFICQKYGDLLAEMENMFIALTASAKPIVAACLLLLGELPSSLRQNSKLHQTDWDWQKLRSRLGAPFVQRLSRYRPEVPRPPPPASSGSTANKDIAVLYQIEQIAKEISGLPEETAPLIETSPALFLLKRWVKLAIDYRRKCLIVTAATLFREARRKKIPLPQLEMEVDIDFQDIPLPSFPSVDA